MIFPIPGLVTVLRWVLSFWALIGSTLPSKRNTSSKVESFNSRMIKLLYPHLHPLIPITSSQSPLSKTKEQYSKNRPKNVMLCYRISNYVHIPPPFHSSPAHPSPTPFPRQPHPNYQTFKKKKRKLHKCPTKNTCKRRVYKKKREKKTLTINQTKQGHLFQSIHRRKEEQTLTFTNNK